MFYFLYCIVSSFCINGDFQIIQQQKGDYIENFNNTANSTGGIILKITTNPEYSGEQQFYAAGFLQGYLTLQFIWDDERNYINLILGGQTEQPTEVQSFVTQQYKCTKINSWIREIIDILEIWETYCFQSGRR